MVMYMLNNRNDIDDVVVDKVDVQLMADLIQTYISRLREFESGRLEMASYCINNNFISNSSSSYQYYNNYNHDSLNFLLKIRSGYSFEGMTYCSQHKKSYVNDYYFLYFLLMTITTIQSILDMYTEIVI